MPKDIFKVTAWYYARYRPGYPKRFFRRVAKTFELNGDGRLLDLGCGPGQLAIPFARYFEEVIAMDPDAAMLREGKLAGKKAKVKNIKPDSQNISAGIQAAAVQIQVQRRDVTFELSV